MRCNGKLYLKSRIFAGTSDIFVNDIGDSPSGKMLPLLVNENILIYAYADTEEKRKAIEKAMGTDSRKRQKSYPESPG